MVDRGKWASKAEFLLTVIGYCVGIGNIWRFPYLCYRSGGGAFLIPYILMLIFWGIPMYFLEASCGQFTSLGCISVFKIAPAFKGAGMAIIVVNILITVYFNVLISYSLLFVWKSMSAAVPWTTCDNAWNTAKCVELTNRNTTLLFVKNSFLNESEKYRTATDEFFNKEILKKSYDVETMGDLVTPLFIANILSWFILFLCVVNGVKSVGKVMYVAAVFPYIILTVLFIRGITLPGAYEGIKFYIFPKWDLLLNPKVWGDSATQIFFSLGPGWGGIINAASYNQFHNKIKRDCIIVPIICCATSIFAGFVIFSVLGFLSFKTGLPVSSVAKEGTGLAFQVYPEALALLPFPQIWSVMFFAMFYTLGMDTCVVQIEAIISGISDEHPKLREHKRLAAFITCSLLALGSILLVFQNGIYLIQLLDWYAGPFTVIFVCIVEVLMIVKCYGLDNYIRDLEFMLNEKLSVWWRLCWRYFTPALLFVVLTIVLLYNTEATFSGQKFPDWAVGLGWMSCLVSFVFIPGYFFYRFFSIRGSLRKKLILCFMPQDWGPADKDIRRDWEEYCKNNY